MFDVLCLVSVCDVLRGGGRLLGYPSPNHPKASEWGGLVGRLVLGAALCLVFEGLQWSLRVMGIWVFGSG